MSHNLGDLLVRRGLITRDQAERAQHAQRQLGGSLAVNLVELGYANEDGIAAVLADGLEIQLMHGFELQTVSIDVIAYLTRDLAEQYRVLPLRLEGHELHVCISDPEKIPELDDLGSTLGRLIKPVLVTETALNNALERHYSIRPELRFTHASAIGPPEREQARQVTQQVERSGIFKVPSVMSPRQWTPPPQASPIAAAATSPRRAQTPPVGIAAPSSLPPPPSRTPPPTLTPPTGMPPSLTPPTPASPSSLTQPKQVAEAFAEKPDFIEQLANVRTAVDVLKATHRFFADLFPQVAILGIHKGRAQVVLAGSRMELWQPAARIEVSLAEGSLLFSVLARPQLAFRPHIEDQSFLGLCGAMKMQPADVALIPVFDHGRPVLIVVGQGLVEAKVRECFPHIKGFLTKVSAALQIVALRKQILGERAQQAPSKRPVDGGR